MNRTKQFALDNQSCYFMVQDTLQARFWAGKRVRYSVIELQTEQKPDYRTLTATYTRATTIIASVTQYIDTIVTNYETVDRLANTTSTYVSQVGRSPPTQTTDCIVPIIPTQLIGLNDSRTEPNRAMYASIIQYKNTTYTEPGVPQYFTSTRLSKSFKFHQSPVRTDYSNVLRDLNSCHVTQVSHLTPILTLDRIIFPSQQLPPSYPVRCLITL